MISSLKDSVMVRIWLPTSNLDSLFGEACVSRNRNSEMHRCGPKSDLFHLDRETVKKDGVKCLERGLNAKRLHAKKI